MKCPKCKFEITTAKLPNFCPNCGVKFKEVNQKVIMNKNNIVTEESVIILTQEELDEAKKDPRPIIEKMKDPNSAYYIPEGAISYDTKDGRTLSHHQLIRLPKQEKIAPPKNKLPIPKGAITITETVSQPSIIEETVYQQGESVRKVIEVPDESKKKPVKPHPRPKFKDITTRKDLSLEEKVEMLERHGYQESAIIQWLEKLEKDEMIDNIKKVIKKQS